MNGKTEGCCLLIIEVVVPLSLDKVCSQLLHEEHDILNRPGKVGLSWMFNNRVAHGIHYQ